MGAVFSGGGAVVSYDDGVQAAASGTTGTQRNEFTAAIKSVTSSITVGAVFLYDTSADSDGGKWRSKCKGLSWFDEASSTTRSARSEFPAMALIVADNAATPTVTIYDLDDPAMPMWMVFSSEASGDSNHFWRYGDATSIDALNGRIIVGKTTAGGSTEIRLVEDKTWNNGSSGTNQMLGGIVDRNSGLGWGTVNTSRTTVNNQHNDVAMTVLEGAPIGELGLPIPTVLCGTDGGVSVIHANGSVYNDTYLVSSTKQAGGVGFNSTGGYWYASRLASGAYHYFVNRHNMIYADTSSATGTEMYRAGASSVGTAALDLLGGASTRQSAWATTSDAFAIGSEAGLSLVKYNTGNPEEGAVCDITSSYNTGYMVGDIRGAFLANSLTVDSSVKANAIVAYNSPSLAAVATDAELQGVDLNGSNQYLRQAYNADLNFGTAGDFCYTTWINTEDTSGYIYDRADTDSTNRAYAHTSASGSGIVISTNIGSIGTTVIPLGVWTQVVLMRRGSKGYIYINGVEDGGSGTANTTDLTSSDSTATLTIGARYSSDTLLNGKLALFRISATAPTPKQIADIYAAEKPLFQAGAKCLLDENPVNDLAYDKTSGLLHVASETTDDGKTFRGLEAVGSLTSDGTFGLGANKPMDYLSASGGVVAGVGGETAGSDNTSGVGVNLPSIDVRADLNEGESKLPDDGKLHFSGVTTDATPTVIGQIPIAENELYYLKAKTNGAKHNSKTSERCAFEVDAQFVRKIGDDVNSPIELRTLSDEQYATSFDVELIRDTSSNTAKLQVTGVAAMRINWTASVEVQRISDKTYER